MNHHSTHVRLLLAIATSAVLMVSCSGEPDYPQSLVQADSAYLRGDYAQADSLLALYQASPSSDESVGKYAQLIALEQAFVHGQLSADHFSDADSLCRYYNKKGTREKLAKAQLFLGDVYRVGESYPEALSCLLKAEKILQDSLSVVKAWIYQKLGDIYFAQRMFDECKNYYRMFYHVATVNNDVLRTAYGANRMGKVCTIESRPDSAIYYFKQSIQLAKGHPQESKIVPYSLSSLCDIYIQIGEYDSAKIIMPRNELNDENWAYWHYGQNHTDSAIYYFKRMLGKYNWYSEIIYLKVLVQLEKEKGDLPSALYYSERESSANDSLTVRSQVEATQKAKAQHEYSMLKQERDQIEIKNNHKAMALRLSFMGFAVACVILCLFWKSHRQKVQIGMERERFLLREEQERYRKSLIRIEDNNKEIERLREQLEEANQRGDAEMVKRIQLETTILTTENQNIEALHNMAELSEHELKDSDLYVKIKKCYANPSFKLKDEEWSELGKYLDATYGQFSNRLQELANFKAIEMRVCYLLKLDLPSVAIANIVGRGDSTISMLGKRVYKKLTGREGNTKELRILLRDF